VVALVVAVLAVLHTDRGRDKVRQQLVKALAETFPGGFELQRLEGSVFGTVTARGIVIFDHNHRRAVTLERASVSVGFGGLLRHTIHLKRLDLDGLSVLAFDDGHTLNLATLMKPRQSDSASTWRVQIDDMRLARGSVALTRLAADSSAILASDHFDDIAVRGTATVEPGGSVLSSVTTGFRWRERNLTAELRGGVQLRDGVVKVARADARFGDVRAVIRELRFASPANVAGVVEVSAGEGGLRGLLPTLPASPSTTLTIQVKPQTNDVLRVTVSASFGAATLSGDVVVAPLLARPRVTGELRIHNVQPAAMLGAKLPGELAGALLLQAKIAFDATGSRDSRSLDSVVATLRCGAELGYGSRTRAPIDLDARLQNGRLVATVTGSLTSALPGCVPRQGLPEATALRSKKCGDSSTGSSQVHGTVDVSIGEHRPLQVHAARLRGHLVAKDLPAEIRVAPTIAGIADIDLNAQGNVDLGTVTSSEAPVVSPSIASTAPTTRAAADRRSAFTITGTFDGAGLRFAGYAAETLHIELSPAVVAAWPHGNVIAKLTGIRADGARWPNVELRAASAATGVIDVDVRLRGWSETPPSSATATLLAAFANTGTLDLSASIRPDRDHRGAAIALRDFRAAVRGFEITAKTGQFLLRPERQEVRGLELHNRGGTVAIDGVHAGKTVTASIAIDKLELAPLAHVVPQLAGLQGRVQLQGSGSWRGKTVEGTMRGEIAQLVARSGAAPIDAAVMATASPRLLHLELRARSAPIGELVVDTDIAPPADLLSRSAWQALERRSLRRLSVHSARLDLGAVQRTLTVPRAALDGHAAVDLELSPLGGTLRVAVAELSLPGNPVAMNVDFGGELDADGKADLRATAHIATITVSGTAALRIPTRPLGLAAWTLTPERITRATLEIPRFAITDALASTLGLGNWRGQASASLDLQLDVNRVTGRVAFHDIVGGPLQRPIDVAADLTTDAGIVHVTGESKVDGIPAMTITLALPLLSLVGGNTTGASFAPKWTDLPLQGAIRFGPLPAAAVARVLGASANNSRLDPESTTAVSSVARSRDAAIGTTRDQRSGASAVRPPSRLQGTLRGDLKLTGTLGAPDVALNAEIANLGSQRGKIRELRLVGRYAAGAAHAELIAANDNSGHLRGVVDLDVSKPADARIAVSAVAFDVSPLARLVPAALLGVTAKLDGTLEARGLDPKQMQVAGNLVLSNLRLPLANQLGALTNTTIRLTFGAGRLVVGLQGDIEAGKVTATASAALDGILPRSGTLDLALSDLALIAPMTPTVGAKLHVDAHLASGRWNLDARLSDGVVRIPAEEGHVLHPINPPADVVFVANARNVEEPSRRLAPAPRNAASRASSPWLAIALAIESVTVRTAEATGTVRGKIDINIADSGLSTNGIIRLTGGDVLLFGRRYQIARAALTFDGPLDPTVDAELRHDFPQLTLTAMITGRTSKPQFHFRSSPSDYTEAQLLSFFLGGNPSASGRVVEVANSVAAAVASQTLGAMITRQLPVRLDVLSYQPQTTSSSGALVAGRWITEQLLLLVRNRTNPRPLENGAEGELQYWLRRGLLLDGVAGDRGTFGLDLLWNRRW